MNRAEALALSSVSAVSMTSAISRLRAAASLSPPDVAFFHQATWNAAGGRGFTQTALEFDSGALLGSIHLSLVRAVWVPLYALLPAAETLIGLQAVVVTAGAAAAGMLCAPDDRSRVPWILLVGASPITWALATCDLRPLTFLIAPAVLAVAGIVRGRTLWIGVGIVGTLAAREEAWMVLAALIPLALCQPSRSRRWPHVAILMGGLSIGLALPRLVWGHGNNITANTDLVGTVIALWDGTRPLLRWPVELYFATRVLVAAWPAVRCPELLLPALAGWAWISIFSNMEPAAPDHGGLHYLSVVAPLVLGAAAVGLTRVLRDASPTRRPVWLAAALGGLLLSTPEAIDSARWVTQAVAPSPLAVEVARIRATSEPVLSVSPSAPLLSGRSTLRIQGHFSPTPDRVHHVAHEIHHALLPANRPPEGGAPGTEWDQWQEALPAAGLKVRATVEGITVWERVRD